MNDHAAKNSSSGPLKSLEDWDDFVKDRYAVTDSAATPVTFSPNKKKEEFRNHDSQARACVKEFYRLNHTYQTRDFVLQKKKEFPQQQQYLRLDFVFITCGQNAWVRGGTPTRRLRPSRRAGFGCPLWTLR